MFCVCLLKAKKRGNSFKFLRETTSLSLFFIPLLCFVFSLFQFLTVGSSFTLPVLACTPEEQESRVVWIFHFVFGFLFFVFLNETLVIDCRTGWPLPPRAFSFTTPQKKQQTNSCRLWISILVGRSFASWWRWHGSPFVCMWTLFCSFLNFLWSFYSNRNRL